MNSHSFTFWPQALAGFRHLMQALNQRLSFIPNRDDGRTPNREASDRGYFGVLVDGNPHDPKP